MRGDRDGGSRARPGAYRRPRDCGRSLSRPAARHPLGREGHHRGQGLSDNVGSRPVQRSRARRGCDGRVATRRCRRGAHRETRNRRARARRPLVRRSNDEPVGRDDGFARVLSGSRFGDGCRAGRILDRKRDARVDCGTLGHLRCHWSAADVRAHQPSRRDGTQLEPGQTGTDVSQRRRLRARTGCRAGVR